MTATSRERFLQTLDFKPVETSWGRWGGFIWDETIAVWRSQGYDGRSLDDIFWLDQLGRSNPKKMTDLFEVNGPAQHKTTVFVPTDCADSVREGHCPVEESNGVRLLRVDPDAAVFAIGSGDYTFLSSWTST